MGETVRWCRTPLGDLLLAADEKGLTGAWFRGQKYFPREIQETEGKPSALDAAEDWLHTYFAGQVPERAVPLHLIGSDFQRAVWQLLLEIPYGATTTYGALARALAARQGRGTMSAQAVGGAVGRNRLSIFVPCHRVLGADGSITGYAGGLYRKAALLQIEQAKKRSGC